METEIKLTQSELMTAVKDYVEKKTGQISRSVSFAVSRGQRDGEVVSATAYLTLEKKE